MAGRMGFIISKGLKRAMIEILEMLIFLIPPYIANSSPVVLGGGRPLDLNITLGDGERLLGDGKTIQGFAAGVLAGTAAGGIISHLYLLPYFASQQDQFIAAFLLSFGTMAGDAVGSFIKRRMHIASGKQFFLDTIFFLIVALVFVYPVANPGLYDAFNVVFFLALTALLHPLTNFLANRVGLKRVPW